MAVISNLVDPGVNDITRGHQRLIKTRFMDQNRSSSSSDCREGGGGVGDEMEVETTHPNRMSKKSELVSVLCTVPLQSRVSVQNTLAGRSLKKSEECSRINLPKPCDRLLPH